MIHNQSLWIDEGYTVPYASATSFGDFLDELSSDVESEALMPLGVFASWVGGKVFGTSEVGLRLVSIGWIVFAVIVMWRVGLMVEAPWLAAVFACHPFVWYYGGEARPYAMVIAMSSGLLYSLVATISRSDDDRRGLAAFLIFAPLMAATHALAVVPVFFVTVILALILRWRRWIPNAREIAGMTVSFSILGLLGAYFAWNLAKGVETVWEGPWSFSFGNTLFSAYEFLGFAGFGPGRHELRQAAIAGGPFGAAAELFCWTGVGAGVLVLLYLLVAVRFFQSLRSGWSKSALCGLTAAVVISGTVAVAMAMAFATGVPFWGRHLAGMLVFLVFTVVTAADWPRAARQGVPSVLTIALAAVLLASSAMVRFHPDHRRDDYRGAARIASAAIDEGKVVWWAAGPDTAFYYNVRFCESAADSGDQCVVYAVNLEPHALAKLRCPDLVILGKPDLYDMNGALRGFLLARGFTLSDALLAFQIFELALPGTAPDALEAPADKF